MLVNVVFSFENKCPMLHDRILTIRKEKEGTKEIYFSALPLGELEKQQRKYSNNWY